jgi:hypothetical protein
MLSSSAPKSATKRKAQVPAWFAWSILTRRVWLPKIFYDAVPYFYLAAGVVAFLTTLYVAEWFWVLPHYLLFSLVCLHFGIIVLRRRHHSGREGNKPASRTSSTQT